MSTIVEISPVPLGTTQETVSEVFQECILSRHVFLGQKVLLEFMGEADIDAFEFAFGDTIQKLGNANVKIMPPEFQWPSQEEQKSMSLEPVPCKQSSTIPMDEKVEEKKQQTQFIIINGCDQKLVDEISTQSIKQSIFKGFQIGRVFRSSQEVYVQFLNCEEVQNLEDSFPGMTIKQLGSECIIDLVEENFNVQIAEEKATQYQKLRQKMMQKQLAKQEENTQVITKKTEEYKSNPLQSHIQLEPMKSNSQPLSFKSQRNNSIAILIAAVLLICISYALMF